MNKPVLAALLALAPLACAPSSADQPPLAGATIGGPFALTDQDGRRVTEAAYAGQYRIMYFGFTYCPDVCPVDLGNIANGLRRFEKSKPQLARKVTPIFVSVDPARDTPAVMKPYVAAFHPRLVGLTGTPAEIAATAKRYAIAFSRLDGGTAKDYLVGHARIAALYGPDGKPIAILPAERSAEAVAEELTRWVT